MHNGAEYAGRAIFAAAALGFAVMAQAAQDPIAISTLPPDLAKVVQDYDRATFENDVVAYDAIVADDYLLVNSDASMEDKTIIGPSAARFVSGYLYPEEIGYFR